MTLLTKLLGALVSPIRSLFFWLGQMIPGFKKLPKFSFPARVGLMVFFALLIVLIVGITQIFMAKPEDQYRNPWFVLLVSLPFLFVIPYGCYLLTKLLLTKHGTNRARPPASRNGEVDAGRRTAEDGVREPHTQRSV